MLYHRRLWATEGTKQLVLVGVTGELAFCQLAPLALELRHAVILGSTDQTPALKAIEAAIAHMDPKDLAATHQHGDDGRMRLPARQAGSPTMQLRMGLLAERLKKQ
jgi:hypothetical protein